jgi:hypothetical protein
LTAFGSFEVKAFFSHHVSWVAYIHQYKMTYGEWI